METQPAGPRKPDKTPTVEYAARLFSRVSPTLADSLVRNLAAQPLVRDLIRGSEKRRLRTGHAPREILIIPDINIGDAVIAQSLGALIKASYPDTEIDFLFQQKAQPLIRSNPHFRRLFPHITGSGLPTAQDLRTVHRVIRRVPYDIIFNLSPYVPARLFKDHPAAVLHSLSLISRMVRSLVTRQEKASYAFQFRRFSSDMVAFMSRDGHGRAAPPANSLPVPHIYTDASPLKGRAQILERMGISDSDTLLFYNPDASSFYTCMPVAFQARLLTRLLSLPKPDRILMNRGFTFKNIEAAILKRIPLERQDKLSLLPKNTRIDVYASLTDRADMFLSGDTGPLHIAAARKIALSSPQRYANATALVGVFGATNGEMYGYDSDSPNHAPAPQNAPSRIFEGAPPCKNLTCVDKIWKNCRHRRCFEGLEPEAISEYVGGYFS